MGLHKDLTGSELHENKGVSAASDNTVATASSGSTVWQKVTGSMIDTGSIFNTNKTQFVLRIDDISTAETIYFTLPFACTITAVYSVIHGAITVADAVITCRNHSGGSMGTITVTQSGSAAGDTDSLAPAINNTFTAGQHMSIETDGGSTTTVKVSFTVVATITG